MGYRFWDLYIFKTPPIQRWRGAAALDYTKEMDCDPYGGKRLRRKWGTRFIVVPVFITLFTGVFGYYMLKSQGWLHMLVEPKEGIQEWWGRTLGRLIEKSKLDEKLLRRREAYKKAIELQEKGIMEKYAKYEEKSVKS